jgi:hypothetical protein
MMKFRGALALLAFVGAFGFSIVSSAAATWLPNVSNAPSRFSAPGIYTGAPDLPLTLSLVMAGGGPSDFQTITLVKTLAGSKTDAEVASLKAHFGDQAVTNFVTIFPFVIADSLRIAKAKGVALPSMPVPNPQNGEALAGALWAAGQTGNGFSVEVMLDRAVSHGIHDQVMSDIDAKYGIAKDADYHAVLNQAMHDLATVYSLNANGKPNSAM